MEINMNNIITIAGDESKKKKGGGTNAVLTLMKELGDFQNKVESCIDAQDIDDSRKKLEIFYDKLDEMAEVLLKMASVGIKSKRKLDLSDDEVVEEEESEVVEDSLEDSLGDSLEEALSDKPSASSVGRIQMINAPSIPRLPR
jgi:hypothetical protein